jgi:hypothetical protein
LLPHLAHLNLFKNWEFGDEQLSRCSVHMLGLRSLDLRGTWVTAAGMADLTQLSSLTRLALAPHVELKPDQMGVMEALTQLKSLTLSCPAYSPALMAAVAKLTQLRVRPGPGPRRGRLPGAAIPDRASRMAGASGIESRRTLLCQPPQRMGRVPPSPFAFLQEPPLTALPLHPPSRRNLRSSTSAARSSATTRPPPRCRCSSTCSPPSRRCPG